MITSYPAASSTSAAALAVLGWKWLLKVSGQSSTFFVPERARRFLNCSTNVVFANRGIFLSRATPPSVFKIGSDMIAFAMSGAISAMRAHQ